MKIKYILLITMLSGIFFISSYSSGFQVIPSSYDNEVKICTLDILHNNNYTQKLYVPIDSPQLLLFLAHDHVCGKVRKAKKALIFVAEIETKSKLQWFKLKINDNTVWLDSKYQYKCRKLELVNLGGYLFNKANHSWREYISFINSSLPTTKEISDVTSIKVISPRDIPSHNYHVISFWRCTHDLHHWQKITFKELTPEERIQLFPSTRLDLPTSGNHTTQGSTHRKAKANYAIDPDKIELFVRYFESFENPEQYFRESPSDSE